MFENGGFRALTEFRSALYRLLSGLYLTEVDAEQLAALKGLSFPDVAGSGDADMDLRQGYALLSDALRETEKEDLDELAAEYARIFLAAGEASGKAAFPYASVYLDRKHRVGGDMDAKMRALYLARGLEPDPAAFRTMHDHIGLMLEYMAVLCGEQLAAADGGRTPVALLREQRAFLREDLQSWVYAFTADVIKYARMRFYSGVAFITNGFLKKESEFLKEAVEEWATA